MPSLFERKGPKRSPKRRSKRSPKKSPTRSPIPAHRRDDGAPFRYDHRPIGGASNANAKRTDEVFVANVLDLLRTNAKRRGWPTDNDSAIHCLSENHLRYTKIADGVKQPPETTLDGFRFTRGIAGGPNGGENRIYVRHCEDHFTRLVFHLVKIEGAGDWQPGVKRFTWKWYFPENEDEVINDFQYIPPPASGDSEKYNASLYAAQEESQRFQG